MILNRTIIFSWYIPFLMVNLCSLTNASIGADPPIKLASGIFGGLTSLDTPGTANINVAFPIKKPSSIGAGVSLSIFQSSYPKIPKNPTIAGTSGGFGSGSIPYVTPIAGPTKPSVDNKAFTARPLLYQVERQDNTAGIAAGTYLTPNPYPSKIPIFPYIEPNLQYKQPSPTYSQPRLTKNQPKLTYKKPRPTFNQARPTYSQPSPIYNKPSPTYNQPRPIYNQPRPTYSQPSRTYSQSRTTYSQTNRIGSYTSTSNSISQVSTITDCIGDFNITVSRHQEWQTRDCCPGETCEECPELLQQFFSKRITLDQLSRKECGKQKHCCPSASVAFSVTEAPERDCIVERSECRAYSGQCCKRVYQGRRIVCPVSC